MDKKKGSHGGARENSGGAREGAGRHKLPKGLALSDDNKVNVRLSGQEKEKAKAIGDGNVSTGIRLAIAAYKLNK